MFKLVLATEDPVLCLAALDSQLFFAVKSTILIYSLVVRHFSPRSVAMPSCG
jgi:hypothetical protein